eukprot:TRINITY_DN67052_c1_g7_i1.p1 TRINITY_DN67052_c1_g7~~TRINITY_DN67052_c1_g7_i1.p1  ORF type:complete len:507 (-),score=64.23 TRINITY_DN67052_c1_g7_i1:109-1629(-)
MEEAVLVSGPSGTNILRLSNGANLHRLEKNKPSGPFACAFVQDTLGLYFAQKDKPLIHSYYPTKDTPLNQTPAPEAILSMACSPDRTYIAAGSTSGKVFVWTTSNGLLLTMFDAHFNAVTSMSYTPDGGFLLTSSKDTTIKVWNLLETLDSHAGSHTKPTPASLFSDHTLAVTQVVALAKPGWLLSVSQDRSIRVCDFTTKTHLYSTLLPSALSCCAAPLIATRAFAGGIDGNIYSVKFYGPLDGGERNPTNALSASSGALPFLIPKTVQELPEEDTQSQKYITMSFHKGMVSGLTVTADDTKLVSGGQDGQVGVWDVLTCQRLRSLTVMKGGIWSVQFLMLPVGVEMDKRKQAKIHQLRKRPSSDPLVVSVDQENWDALAKAIAVETHRVEPTVLVYGDVDVKTKKTKGSKRKQQQADAATRGSSNSTRNQPPTNNTPTTTTTATAKATPNTQQDTTTTEPEQKKQKQDVADSAVVAELQDQINRLQQVNSKLFKMVFPKGKGKN